jgi:hypothetical protein
LEAGVGGARGSAVRPHDQPVRRQALRLSQLQPRRPHDRDHRARRTSAPADDRPTAAEAEALFRGVVSYAGPFTLDGDQVTHHVEISWNESWTGTIQKRTVRFDGERLQLSTPVSPDPLDGLMSVRTMTWERVDGPPSRQR